MVVLLMTLEVLNDHLYILNQLQAAEERLQSMKAVILGAQRYDGMPHGHEVSRNSENLAILLENQVADVNRLESMVEKSEIEVRRFVDSINDNRTKVIFNLRFLCGLPWDDVAHTIGGGNTSDTVRMTAYRYLQTPQAVSF